MNPVQIEGATVVLSQFPSQIGEIWWCLTGSRVIYSLNQPRRRVFGPLLVSIASLNLKFLEPCF